MKLIVDLESYKTNKTLIDRFKELYDDAFPDENEREDFDVILKRIFGEKQPNDPHSILILNTTNTNNPEVTGGLIADWYETSRAIHLIYLVTDKKFRGKGIAKKLINDEDGVNSIINWIKKEKGIDIQNVFFESNNPEMTENDSFDPVSRLEIFSQFGAKWINIPYIQPALDTHKEGVDNLFLLSFPRFNANGDKIREVEIMAFLRDLYLSLGESVKNNNFIVMQNELEKQMNKDGFVELQPIPESSSFKFYKSSVTWHFILKSKYHHYPSENNPFSSFEKDLLNFHNQKQIKPPFESVFKEPILDAKIVFPKEYSYTSEGRTHTKSTKPDRIELQINLSVSYTKIENSENTIWHVTIAPKNNHYFTENELIKLSTMFGSSQEQSKVKDELKITIEEEKDIKPVELINRLFFKEKSARFEDLHTGIVQIETCKLESTRKIDFKDFFNIIQNKNISEIENGSVMRFSKALCGIILGIFDFNRMDEEEIFDTIQPIVQGGSSFILLCRGTLFKITDEDEIMESVSKHIIVSPYLLVPNMVLAFNEFILMEAKKEIDIFLDPQQNKGLKELETFQRKARHILNVQNLRDIFQYPSEKDIVEQGNSQRGINNLYDAIIKRLEELSELIEIKKANRSNQSDAFFNALLAFIAALQLNGLFDQLLNKICSGIYIYVFTAFFAFAIAGAVFWFIMMKKK